MVISLVYSKCTHSERARLWDSIFDLTKRMVDPWLKGGDFNIICNEEEKWVDLLSLKETLAILTMNVCSLKDQGFKGSKFTWWGRMGDDCIFIRLDRVLYNDKM